jgi:hypothetical protein
VDTARLLVDTQLAFERTLSAERDRQMDLVRKLNTMDIQYGDRVRSVAWCDVVWRGVARCGVVWCGVAWRGVAWRGVAWRGVAWRGAAWCGVVLCRCSRATHC